MKLTFRLRFYTRPGQSLYLFGAHKSLGGGVITNALPLHYLNPDFWQISVDIPDDKVGDAAFSYSYVLKNADGSIVQDWEKGRVIARADLKARDVLIIDSWNDAGAVENVFYTEPFQKVLLRRNAANEKAADHKNSSCQLRVKVPILRQSESVCVVGSIHEIRNWNTANAAQMSKTSGDDFWKLDIDLRNARDLVSYKYGIYDTEKKQFVRFEEGNDRTIPIDRNQYQYSILDDGFIRLPSSTLKGAGVAIPVFSLRSDDGFGVGEFSDLKKLVDWSRGVGLKLIQVLPINDTSATDTWRDSYPYAAISAFALHPLYMNLEALTTVKKPLPPELLSERKRLNALDAVDYEAVLKAKIEFIRSVFKEDKKEIFSSAGFKSFFSGNKHWLVPYAAFCALRDKNKTPDFNRWSAHQTYKADEIATVVKKDPAFAEEIDLHYFIQYHLHLQLKDATEYAHANGIIIKGDIAIGVHKHGADVWQQPELFFTDKQAGAPPDPFDAKGQNWGFPTYNWPRMMQDNLLWWQQRFEQMSLYFDAFRIDHILGFFRIWSNPADAIEGILGIFVPAIPVKITEFQERGIPFDHDRYLKPFIDESVLLEFFGDDAAKVKKDFLSPVSEKFWALKTEYASQLKIEEHFLKQKASAQNQKLRQGLFDLVTNVILLPAGKSDQDGFHFRFGMMDTPSFKALDPQIQAKLKDLYVDYFFRRQENLWREQAMQKLPALKKATNMLICGEDLGMVPDCVPVVMKQLGLLSLEIQRMPKTLNTDFSRPTDAPYLSVVTPSTHDMSTIRGWWEEDPKLTQKFYTQELHLSGTAPNSCSAEINRAIVEQHLASPALWSIFQLQDLLGVDAALRRKKINDERINVPANTKNYWRYRMHLTLEELLKSKSFNETLSTLVEQYHR